MRKEAGNPLVEAKSLGRKRGDELIFSVLMCIQVYTTEAGVAANMDAW